MWFNREVAAEILAIQANSRLDFYIFSGHAVTPLYSRVSFSGQPLSMNAPASPDLESFDICLEIWKIFPTMLNEIRDVNVIKATAHSGIKQMCYDCDGTKDVCSVIQFRYNGNILSALSTRLPVYLLIRLPGSL